jgi:two-component system sensor histidine kinase HydH
MLAKESMRNRPEVMSEMTQYIGSEVDRMNGLVSSFLDFARPLQIRPVLTELRPVIDDVVKQHLELANGRGVRVTVHMDDPRLAFAFDPDLLRVAISNLLQNAIQASGIGQEVEIRATAKGDSILIFVSDQGEGIKPQHLESIFNPFFTTKPNGVGLGLAIVAKIVDEHQGRINVFSEPAGGTRFEMMLPKQQDPD